MFSQLLSLISEYAQDDFYSATNKLKKYVYFTNDFTDIIEQIGTIPEEIKHDSTEEKLFAKISDAVLSRAFRELGLKSEMLSERADCADVIAKSDIFGYTLVADAKTFRMSRTAKNQKDYKVEALSTWRKDADYAVLCVPYFQYPRNQSQIYAQAVDRNVCLLSWEHIIFLLKHEIIESKTLNLSLLWNYSNILAHKTVVTEKKKCFIPKFNNHFLSTVNLLQDDFENLISSCIDRIKHRGYNEKAYLQNERNKILAYSHEQAIAELIKSKKIDERIRQIDLYIGGISSD
jgi:type II restriction enzyme